MKNKSLITILCFVIAGLLVLKFFNFSLGSLITSVLPFILIICGFVGLVNGKKMVGSILIVIGALWSLTFLGKWLLLILAGVLVFIGITQYKNRNRSYY